MWPWLKLFHSSANKGKILPAEDSQQRWHQHKFCDIQIKKGMLILYGKTTCISKMFPINFHETSLALNEFLLIFFAKIPQCRKLLLIVFAKRILALRNVPDFFTKTSVGRRGSTGFLTKTSQALRNFSYFFHEKSQAGKNFPAFFTKTSLEFWDFLNWLSWVKKGTNSIYSCYSA